MANTQEPARRIRCDHCGCSLELTADELLEFTRGAWPRCCLRPMILDVADHSVRPNEGTEVERPPRPARRTFSD